MGETNGMTTLCVTTRAMRVVTCLVATKVRRVTLTKASTPDPPAVHRSDSGSRGGQNLGCPC